MITNEVDKKWFLESEARYNIYRDLLEIKVRITKRDKENRILTKKGCIFFITEEDLNCIAEGQEYVQTKLSRDRFTLMALEEEENESIK